MGKKKVRVIHSKEFKKKAVAMSYQDGAKVSDVADQLGIKPQSLSLWRSKFASEQRESEAVANLTASEENRLLREELRQAKIEVEILKKAASYFASQK